MRTGVLTFRVAAAALAISTAAAGVALADDHDKDIVVEREYITDITAEVDETIRMFRESDPGIADWFRDAYGYAILPDVGKGGIGIGAAAGKGEVVEQGKLIGMTKMSQVTVGLQLGGQTYREVVFFEDETALRNFKSSEAKLSAQASAVAITSGASADAEYENGVAIFTMARGGLMFEASVGGQTFKFTPIEGYDKATKKD